MKRSIQKLKSNKLYYNKWPYKIECRYGNVGGLVRRGIEKIRSSIIVIQNTAKQDYWINAYCKNDGDNYKKLLEFIDVLEPLLTNKNIKVRAEHHTFSVFCSSMAVIEELEPILDPWIQNIYGPVTVEECNFLMDNGCKTILRDKLPKEKYQYRIHFGKKWNYNKGTDFLKWSSQYADQIYMNPSTRRVLAGKGHCVQPVMYITDEKMLAIVGFFASGNIKKIEKFVLRENVLLA